MHIEHIWWLIGYYQFKVNGIWHDRRRRVVGKGKKYSHFWPIHSVFCDWNGILCGFAAVQRIMHECTMLIIHAVYCSQTLLHEPSQCEWTHKNRCNHQLISFVRRQHHFTKMIVTNTNTINVHANWNESYWKHHCCWVSRLCAYVKYVVWHTDGDTD